MTEKIVFLEGFKTILRPPDKRVDLDLVTRWINDPEVRQFILMHLPQTFQREEEWFDKAAKDSNDIVLIIVAKPEMRPVGIMGLHRIDWKNRVATTGALIGEKGYWGKGYGTDAKMALLGYAFNELNLNKICSAAFVHNKRSLAYSLHCGYREEGRRRAQVFKNGRYYDIIELGLLRREWLPVWRRYKKTGSVK